MGHGERMDLTKVCIVDDDTEIVESTTLLLEALGYEVVSAMRASDVEPLVRLERPDILLQDVRMPGLDVAAEVKRFRDDPELSSMPIILFTGDIDADEIGQRIGADAVLEKPFDPSDLKALLDELTA